jgi:hypothetical protein
VNKRIKTIYMKPKVLWTLLGLGGLRRKRAAAATGALQYRAGTIYERGRGPVARPTRGAGNAGRGASPTVGKREGFSF